MQYTYPYCSVGEICMLIYHPSQGRSQRGGTWVNVPPPSWTEKNLAPELQTDHCFATGVTRQTLLKPKGKCAISTLIFRKFSGG